MRMVKINSHRHVVLCLLVSVAFHLCGCASGRQIVSTNNTPPGNASVRKVEFGEVPEARALAERARRIGNEMYPKILALLADDSSRLPRQFDVVFKKHLEGNFGQTVGATINLRAEWFTKNSTDLDDTLIHEMSHVAQKYPSKACDYWMEGIADYVRYKLGYTHGWRCPQCGVEFPHYTYGYACAGAFLLFVDATYGSNVVRQLNAELRRGSYSAFLRYFEEAAEFLENLGKNGRLPGFSKDEVSEISPGTSDWECLSEAYPGSRTFTCTKKDDPSAYHYIVVRESNDVPWKLQRAWRTGPDGRVIEEYPLP
ncbi:MAG TPA: basic secretory protein-like protein [Terriglobales bacterium]|nr:basic secretory protein-like protein [Terriglobales bacterium]